MHLQISIHRVLTCKMDRWAFTMCNFRPVRIKSKKVWLIKVWKMGQKSCVNQNTVTTWFSWRHVLECILNLNILKCWICSSLLQPWLLLLLFVFTNYVVCVYQTIGELSVSNLQENLWHQNWWHAFWNHDSVASAEFPSRPWRLRHHSDSLQLSSRSPCELI